ncbi:MAG: ATP phosphoribosyltransferase regulatory subunit [Clostridia bacterium]|nr:ATP phosphoribosyltransferase regulatory subunit [Clostridia bacterium]
MFSTNLLKNEEKAVFALRSIYQKYGYTPFKMSKFEEYDLYVRNKDFLVSDSVITFTGMNGKLLALKPDVTLSIVKNTKDIPDTVQKVYYNENVYRVSPSTHEFREIMQTGLECIGNIDDYNIFEVLMLAAKSLEAISDSFVLDLSHIGIVSAMIDAVGCDRETGKAIINCIGEKNQSGIEKICAEKLLPEDACRKLVALVGTYGKIGKVLPELEAICDTDELKSALSQLKNICNLLVASGIEDKINIDFSIATDMRYYNGVVFQGFVENVPTGVLSGGQYDNLMKKMGRKSGAIGFAVYLDTLERLNLTQKKYDVDTVLIYDENSRPEDIARVVNEITSTGNNVMAQRSVPDSIRYRQLLKLNGKGVEILENND